MQTRLHIAGNHVGEEGLYELLHLEPTFQDPVGVVSGANAKEARGHTSICTVSIVETTLSCEEGGSVGGVDASVMAGEVSRSTVMDVFACINWPSFPLA